MHGLGELELFQDVLARTAVGLQVPLVELAGLGEALNLALGVPETFLVEIHISLIIRSFQTPPTRDSRYKKVRYNGLVNLRFLGLTNGFS